MKKAVGIDFLATPIAPYLKSRTLFYKKQMRLPTGFKLFSKLLLVLLAVQMNWASQEDLLADEFIRYHLYCTSNGSEYEISTLQEHYFYMFTSRAVARPTESFGEVLESAKIMLIEFQNSVKIKLDTFKTEYMNFTQYSSNFDSARFRPFNNQVWNSLQMMFNSNSRFTDWQASRTETVVLNQFTNLIGSQRILMEEFLKFDELLVVWKQTYSMMEGMPDMQQISDLKEQFTQEFNGMKQETIYYLAMVFLAAFEHDESAEVVAKDNVLSSFWAVFYDWLDLGQCNRLVHGAINGGLDAVGDRNTLHEYMYGQHRDEFVNEVKLVWDFQNRTTLEEFKTIITDATEMTKDWEFFSEDQLNISLSLSNDDDSKDRVEFDMLRIEEDVDCMTFIAKIENFVGLKNIMIQKDKFLEDNIYYYLIEYLYKLANDNLEEFPDDEPRSKAIQIIYLFMNYIINTDGDDLTKKDNKGEIIVEIILRILNGMGEDGELRKLIKRDELDETTENYIYMLLFILTEKNNLKKPDESGELDRGRENSIVDDEEEDESLRIDPRNPRFAKIIRRFYVLSGGVGAKNNKIISRYVRKYYSLDLLKNNKIFEMDHYFFELEVAMNKEFTTNDRTFTATKQTYDDAIRLYFTENVKSNHNVPMVLLMKWFGGELQGLKKKKPTANVSQNELKLWYKRQIDLILVGKLGELESNFMENQYMEAVALTCKTFKLPLPNMSVILQSEMKDNDGLNMFEFVKRVISNIKHGRAGKRNGLVDTVDINIEEFDDQSGIPNGERFRTLIIDIVHYFEPEIERLSQLEGPTNKKSISYLDLEKTLALIHSEFKLVDKPVQEMEKFRLMMMWNLFDDVKEYMPLLEEFVDETKSLDGNGSNPLKIEMLVESYTDLYIAILEHRIFAALNFFSFESAQDRINNLVSYLTWRNEQYEDMFTKPMVGKEQRFSKLSPRQVQNLLYFLEFRIMRTLPQEQADQVQMTNLYFPYSFREIYVLLENHPEMGKKIQLECQDFFNTLDSEKAQRRKNYTITEFELETRQLPNFKFCMLIAFNRDIVGLINAIAVTNNERTEMLTMTKESIFEELVVPYYDKLSPHEMIMQIFNMNMTHAKAVARESAEKFSNYISLLDSFLFILNDLEDGQNDTLNVKNLGLEVNETLKNFCLILEKSDDPQNIKYNKVFIRHLLIDKLTPGFLAPGAELRAVFTNYTKAPVNSANLKKFSDQLRYGLQQDEVSIDLKEDGEDIDEELLSLLMIYAPHTEFAVETIFNNNFVSSLPQYIRNAEDNYSRMYKVYVKPVSMDEVYNQAYKTKAVIIKKIQDIVNHEAEIDLDGNFDFDLNAMIGLDDEVLIEKDNDQWNANEIIVPQNNLDSNIQIQDSISKVLIGQTSEMIELTSKNSQLNSGEELYIDTILQRNVQTSENDMLLEEESNLKKSGILNIAQLNVVSSSQDYSENIMEGMNFGQITDKLHQTHISMSDHNQSLNRKFSSQIEEDSLRSNINTMGTLRVAVTGLNSREMMERLQKATQNIAMKMNSGQFQVKINKTSQIISSEKLTSKRISHVSQEIKTFNNLNQEMHVSGNHDTIIQLSQNGNTSNMPIKSYQINKVFNSSSSGNLMKEKLNTMISNQIVKMSSQSKSWTEQSKSTKVIVKKRQIKSLDNLYLI